MAQPSALVDRARARIAQLVTLERDLHAYLAALEAAQDADMALIPPDLRARLHARAGVINDMKRLVTTPQDAAP